MCTKKFASAENLVSHIGWHTRNEEYRGNESLFCVNEGELCEMIMFNYSRTYLVGHISAVLKTLVLWFFSL